MKVIQEKTRSSTMTTVCNSWRYTRTKIWSNTTRTPATANRAAIATDWVADVQDTRGYKEAALMDADTTWKTVPKLKSQTDKFSDKVRDEVERTTTGNVNNFAQALREAELPK